MNKKHNLLILLMAIVAVTTAAQSVTDTLSLAELTVTAIKQGTSDNAPAPAMTVVGSEAVERNRVVSPKTVADLAPGLFIPDYGSRMTSTIYVRGIGTRIDQPAVGLNVDNVPVLCKENYDFDVPDIARVEVLRGPQSTLYGRNTMGGVMNIYTLSPLSYQGTRAMVEAASHGAWRVGVGHYARLGEQWGLGITVYHHRTAGEWRNAFSGHRADWERLTGGRAKLEWNPGSGLMLSNVLNVSVGRQGGYPYEYTGTGQIAYNDTCFYRRTSIIDGLTVSKEWHRLSLMSITSYQYIDDNMTLDQDFTPQPYFTLTQARREHAVTQDVVLRGKRRGDGYNWLAGGMGFYRRLKMRAPVTFFDTGIASLIEEHRNTAAPSYPIAWDNREFELGSNFTAPTWGVALYHESTFTAGKWTLSAGLRLEHEHAALNYRSVTHTGYTIVEAATGTTYSHEPINIDDSGHMSKNHTELLPHLVVTRRLSQDYNTLSLIVSRGSKAGGYNTQMFSDVLQQQLMGMMGIGAKYATDEVVGYKPERAWNFELGSHSEWIDRRLKADVNVYYMDCRDRQLTVFPDGTTTGRVMTNAGRTRSVGVEAAMRVTIDNYTQLAASYGYCDARFVRYNDGRADYRHKQVPYNPTHTLWAEALHTRPLGSDWTLSAAVNVRGAGRICWNESNDQVQPFYALLGASVTMNYHERYSLSLWGTNLTDTNYRTFYFVSIGHEFLQRGHGRVLGITLTIKL